MILDRKEMKRSSKTSICTLVSVTLLAGVVYPIQGKTSLSRLLDLQMPPSHVALSGDLHLRLLSPTTFPPPLLLQLTRLEGDSTRTLTTFPILPTSTNITRIRIPCGFFSKGGIYYITIRETSSKTTSTRSTNRSSTKNSTSPLDINAITESPDTWTSSPEGTAGTDVLVRSLDVRWPMPQLSLTPEHVQTYPEGSVAAVLEFPDVVCTPKMESPAAAIAEFWLELHFCGATLQACDSSFYGNGSRSQALYSEQVRGLPGRRVVTLRCELFGLAGHYVLQLRPTAPHLPHTEAYLKADWSDQFVFNVVQSSIFPCDPHSGGVRVLFEYPSCILESGDRVRLYGRVRANVASLAPPSALEYVTERRVARGQHGIGFECDLFSERHVEYCFVYVSQAITGAVADVRMDCVPTLPVADSDKGGWSPWSDWSPCSSTCIGGTRTRHRFCDSPPPKYGAKFCEGPMVETEKCNTSPDSVWKCLHGEGLPDSGVVASMPEVQAEIGEKCRCGCFLHLSKTKPKRLVATSSLSCPGRLLWQIRADEGHIIQFTVEQFHLPCGTQWLKVRDGSSLSANLLADLSGAPDTTPSVVNSTGPNLILEFVANELFSGTKSCGGGFLAHAKQIRKGGAWSNGTSVPVAQGIGVLPAAVLRLSAVHIAAIFFTSGLILATIFLGAQYLVRYRKYHIAQAEDQDSLAGMDASCSSLQVRTRASSNTTLLSEVISLTRFKPLPKNKHIRLRESLDLEKKEQEATLAKEEDSLTSSSSTETIHDVNTRSDQPPAESPVAPPTTTTEETCFSEPCTPKADDESTTRRHSLCRSEKEKLTNGCYSPASIISKATIRSTNIKENKEKRNRERLLAGPVGSDFSLTGQDVDLEMDYYDYNVVNAGAAPGSYLGMDPAFLVWIPPLDESGEILGEEGEGDGEVLGRMVRPRQYVDPGSNKESPEEELLLPKKNQKNHNKIKINEKVNRKINIDQNRFEEEIQMSEFESVGTKFAEEKEKETKVEKNVEKEMKIEKSLDEDIKFVDEDEDAIDVTNDKECNIESYHRDSNVLSSS